jgi:hypothetical protein
MFPLLHPALAKAAELDHLTRPRPRVRTTRSTRRFALATYRSRSTNTATVRAGTANVPDAVS